MLIRPAEDSNLPLSCVMCFLVFSIGFFSSLLILVLRCVPDTQSLFQIGKN